MDLKLEVLRKEVKLFRKNSGRVMRHLLTLIELTKFKQKWGKAGEQDYEQIAVRFDISGRSLYRWEAAYRKVSVEALVPGKAPGRKASIIRGHTAQKSREWRKLYNWGAEVIQALLKQDHGNEVSQFKINEYLRAKDLRN